MHVEKEIKDDVPENLLKKNINNVDAIRVSLR